jgi:hypothetical protein
MGLLGAQAIVFITNSLTHMTPDVATRLNVLVESIKAHHFDVDAEACRLRTPEVLASFDKRRPVSWCLAAMGDSLVRIRLLLEQNFNFVETIGVVAVSRYLFELSVWLLLFEQDERYGLVYYGQLLETQQKYFADTLAQIRREVELLRHFERKEQDFQEVLVSRAGPPEDRGDGLRLAARMIDAEAARKFSLYVDQAKRNGYGFQAHLVEKKAVTQAEAALRELSAEQAFFEVNVLPGIEGLVLANGKKKRWEWKKMAERVNLLPEYDYIYAFASKLLHATPASITTDQKNLEPEEMLIFLKYIDVKTTDILDLARRYPRHAA